MFLDRAQAGDWRSRFDMKEREAAIAPLRRHLTGVELLAVVPIVGVMSLFGEGKPLPLFGLFEIPSPWPKDKAFTEQAEEIHEILANVLLSLAALHSVAALVHHWVFHDRTLSRMLPGDPATTATALSPSSSSSPRVPLWR